MAELFRLPSRRAPRRPWVLAQGAVLRLRFARASENEPAPDLGEAPAWRLRARPGAAAACAWRDEFACADFSVGDAPAIRPVDPDGTPPPAEVPQRVQLRQRWRGRPWPIHLSGKLGGDPTLAWQEGRGASSRPAQPARFPRVSTMGCGGRRLHVWFLRETPFGTVPQDVEKLLVNRSFGSVGEVSQRTLMRRIEHLIGLRCRVGPATRRRAGAGGSRHRSRSVVMREASEDDMETRSQSN